MSVLYENQQYHPNFQYMTGVARDDASYLLCKFQNIGRKSIVDIRYTTVGRRKGEAGRKW